MSVKVFPLTSANILRVKSKETVTAPNGKASSDEFVFQSPKTIYSGKKRGVEASWLVCPSFLTMCWDEKSLVNEGHILSYLILAADTDFEKQGSERNPLAL